jgi:hypothetical protein
MHAARSVATLEPVRFGEFLLHRQLISDEQWIAALAAHWSALAAGGKRRKFGSTIVAHGFLAKEVVEAEARAFHDDIEVVEVTPRSERVTAEIHLTAGSARS